MRKFSTGFGLVCCISAAFMLGACAKNKDCGECCGKDKAAMKSGSDINASMMGEKKDCASKCASKCAASCEGKKADVSPSMMGEKKNCASSCTGKKSACPAQAN